MKLGRGRSLPHGLLTGWKTRCPQAILDLIPLDKVYFRSLATILISVMPFVGINRET